MISKHLCFQTAFKVGLHEVRLSRHNLLMATDPNFIVAADFIHRHLPVLGGSEIRLLQEKLYKEEGNC